MSRDTRVFWLLVGLVAASIQFTRGINESHPARSYAWSINRTTRAQSCTLIGGAAPRPQWSSASLSAVKAGAVTLAPDVLSTSRHLARRKRPRRCRAVIRGTRECGDGAV